MGRGIAQWFAQAGVSVELADANSDTLQAAKEEILKRFERACKKGETIEQKPRLQLVEAFNPDSDLLIEAIVEKAEAKEAAFKILDQHFSTKTIFASNTSSLSINCMAINLTPARREKFLGLHFFNPAPLMKLVEVIKGQDTDQVVLEGLQTWFEEHGKTTALSCDRPGFIVNRIARNFYGESLRIVNSEDQELMRETDQILKEVGGFKMGPFALMDLIGIDINYTATYSIWQAFFGDPRFAPHPLQRQMVESGRLGKKTGGGFYSYS